MSIKVRYTNGVFQPLEEVCDARPGQVYRVFSEEELRSLTKDLDRLKVSKKSFDFWNNEEDDVYDEL